MKSQNNRHTSARSLKVSLLATLGVYMALSSSHWTTPADRFGQADHLSSFTVTFLDEDGAQPTGPSEIAGIHDDALPAANRARSGANSSSIAGLDDDALLTIRARQAAAAATTSNSNGPSEIAGISDDAVLTNRARLTVSTSGNASDIAGINDDSLLVTNSTSQLIVEAQPNTPAPTPHIIEVCERKFNAAQDGQSYTFTEVMESDCTDCVVASYSVAVQADTIAQTLAEVAVSTLGDRVCPQVADENPDLTASSSEVEETDEEEVVLSAWELCGEHEDEISELQCYAEVLTERKGRNFIDEVLADLGEKPSHMQFLNAVKVRLNDVNRLLEKLIDTEDESVASHIGEISREISQGLHEVFSNRKFTRLGQDSSASAQLRASQANFINRSIETLVANYQSWGRKGDFRVQELNIIAQTNALTLQSENLRRQFVGLNPESLQLVRGFMTSYMNTTNNPRYLMDPFYRQQMDMGFQTQLQMLNNMDPGAAAAAYQWQTLAQEGLALRANSGSALQQIIQMETNPAARTALVQDYNTALQGISNSVDLTRNDLYDPYFMSFDLLNSRTTSTAGRSTQFHTTPLAEGSISTLPGNSQYSSNLSDLLNSRTFSVDSTSGTSAPAPEVRPQVGRVSY